MLYFVVGTVCMILLWKALNCWRHVRREAEYVRRALSPYAGLNFGAERSTPESHYFGAARDFLWGAALVVALLVFGFAIAVRVLR